MGKVLITGPGRSCSNWVCEIARMSGAFEFWQMEMSDGYIVVEDRELLKRGKLEETYGAKLCTENFKWEELNTFLHKYQDVQILFATRHPVDLAMAKVVRGQPSSQGGDGSDQTAPDATVEGAVAAINHANGIFNKLQKAYGDRLMQIKLEDLLSITVMETIAIGSFLGVATNEEMISAYAFNRNKHHNKRYQGSKDMGQLGTRHRWDDVYGGYFKDRELDIKHLQKELAYVIEDWNYTKMTNYNIQVRRNYIEGTPNANA